MSPTMIFLPGEGNLRRGLLGGTFVCEADEQIFGW